MGGRGDPQHQAHPGVGGADRERDPRAKREPSGPDVEVGIPSVHPVDRTQEVVRFTATLIVGAIAFPDAAEVETQGRAPYLAECLR